ncbi:MAG: hypothetical protein D6696_17770 [Acidobacteria bacterium]|nr:MAG: hypothetical protein D6696_17770 [Acidobacteriota bacterium]
MKGVPTPGRWPLAAVLLAAVLGAPGVTAQDPPAEDPPPPTVEAEAEGDAEGADVAYIDDLLAQDEEVLYSDEGSTYDPGARRDPFRSLLQPTTSSTEEGERPEGLAGLLIDEIEVQGVFITPEGPVAQIIAASDETSYLLRPGDQLWDGDVVRITLEEVVFKKKIDDPDELKPFREVVKKLNL